VCRHNVDGRAFCW